MSAGRVRIQNGGWAINWPEDCVWSVCDSTFIGVEAGLRLWQTDQVNLHPTTEMFSREGRIKWVKYLNTFALHGRWPLTFILVRPQEIYDSCMPTPGLYTADEC